jgi:hypothetical protein
MAREIGPGDRVGTVNVGWNDPYGDFDYFEIDFGDHTATLRYEESYGTWLFEITEDGHRIYNTTVYRDATGGRHKGALDAGTTELMSWFLTEALG